MHALPITAALVGTALTAQGPDSRARGRHYEVICHFEHPTAAKQALAIAEAAWPVALGVYGDKSRTPEQPLRIHLYRDAAAYAEAEAALTGGRFKRNLAFAHYATKSAHVAVQPRLPDEVFDRVGLTFQTLRLLVHEAAHLARYEVMSNYRSHPGWFADGNATWIEAEVLRAQGQLESVEADPSFAAKIGLVQGLLQRGELPTADQILRDDTDDLEFYETYAVRWQWFDFLMSGDRKRAFAAVIADMHRYAGGDFRPRLMAALRRELGEHAFDRLDREFAAHVEALRPQWDEQGRSLETAGSSWVHTAFDGTDAIAWRTERAGPADSCLSGEVTILPDGDRELDVLLGRSDECWITVAFRAGEPVTITRDGPGGRRIAELGRATAPPLETGRSIAFRIVHLRRGELRVDLEGKQVLKIDLDQPLDGAWGLGARSGSSGIWKGVALHPRTR